MAAGNLVIRASEPLLGVIRLITRLDYIPTIKGISHFDCF